MVSKIAKDPPKGSKGLPEERDKEGRVTGRHRALLSDPKVRSWWEARSLRSRLSADQYLRQLGMLLERTDLTPEKAIVLARKDPSQLFW